MGAFKSITCGGNGGSAFATTTVGEFKMYSGSEVDSIYLNGEKHGGDGGGYNGTFLLQKNNDYIIRADVYYGENDEVHHLHFWNNRGEDIGGGHFYGTYKSIDNIRLVTIGGRSGRLLDQIQITYVENYVPSTLVDNHAVFIVKWYGPNTQITNYTSQSAMMENSYQLVTSTMSSSTISSSAEAEYGAQVSVATSQQFTDSTVETIANSLKVTLETQQTTILKVNDDEVGIMLVEGTIMRADDGKYWMFPNSGNNFAVIKKDDWRNMLNTYDLTGDLYKQMGQLADHKTTKNDYVFYSEETN